MNALGSGPYYIFTIGGYFNGGATSFAFYKGKMDEFRLYASALSNGEINYSYWVVTAPCPKAWQA